MFHVTAVQTRLVKALTLNYLSATVKIGSVLQPKVSQSTSEKLSPYQLPEGGGGGLILGVF